MDLFLSIDLPKLEDIAHIPPQFPEYDNWATPHKSNRNHHVYYSSLGFWKRQPWTDDGIEHQHKQIPRGSNPHNGM